MTSKTFTHIAMTLGVSALGTLAPLQTAQVGCPTVRLDIC